MAKSLTKDRNQYHSRSKYYTQYLQLAISIAVDMRFDRRPNNNRVRPPENKRDPLVKGELPEKYGVAAQAWGPEEQRAAAGIFYISSTYVPISRWRDEF